jgi:hypothetical protein
MRILLELVIPVTAGIAQVFTADLAETTLQLAAVERVIFAHGSGGEHEFVAESGRDGAAGFQECLQMGVGRFLKPKNGCAPVTAVCVAAGKQG